ncbi:lipoprotein LpqH [[Mycobacterium] crassicus]|uniref:Lipoprotein LpqH n=1 Tax=[Mycobacterium] crassicus TaxID=2872309 RepID=A0ABU5XI43_9MYCO|nr:lipoprotein LpqH [Mycolicibacter sp. MYC098]MEB3020786.1 lipoprotein LpqH [Mycolicibacter sp. MYC098]
MKRSVTVAAAAAAIAVVGLSGCSSEKKTESAPAPSSHASHSSSESSASVNVGGAAANTKVTIDGQDQNVTGTTVCTTMAGDVNIAIGGAATGIAAVLSDANPPEVKSVGLGNVNGVTLAYTAGTGQGDAKATKDGNEYKISGTATGVDMANPMQPVNKPFEIDVTCS